MITITDERGNKELTFKYLDMGEAFISSNEELFIVAEESDDGSGLATNLKTGHIEKFKDTDTVIPVDLEIIITDQR